AAGRAVAARGHRDRVSLVDQDGVGARVQPILRGLRLDQPRGATRPAEHLVPRTAAAGCRVAGDVLAALSGMAANARRCTQPEAAGALLNAYCRTRARATTTAYSAASFSFFSARVLIFTVAGLAAKTRSTFVNGSIPVRFFFAGTLITLTFSKPGSVKVPSPF